MMFKVGDKVTCREGEVLPGFVQPVIEVAEDPEIAGAFWLKLRHGWAKAKDCELVHRDDPTQLGGPRD